ncbi:MAG: DNA repair protein RadA [Anaerolineae bacterium]|nr:MAG: DNA repair protein RadA [Anaerolineae bacterium]
MGKCPQCGEFGTMVEQITVIPSSQQRSKRGKLIHPSQPKRLNELSINEGKRLKIDLDEFSRVLGGGFVPGSLLLIGGSPGIGKSTLMLEIAGHFARTHGRVLYVSGEESALQIKMRADRMQVSADEMFLVTETGYELILKHIEEVKPALVIIDSIQTTFTEDLTSSAGSVSQVRECAGRFQEVAKHQTIIIVLAGHVTKEGAIAGPRVLEHIVDTVLYLEGDPFHRYRLLRTVKNRFGPTNEVGVFEMTGGGLKEVPNPSQAFLEGRQVKASGSTIAVMLEGTRPLLVEIQALVNSTAFSNPRRTVSGVDYQRLLLIAAILERRAGIRLHDKDIYANVIGGIQLQETAADLAIAVAIASSVKDRPVHADVAFIGELGLSGEIRSVNQIDWRLKEAAKLGFGRCIMPKSEASKSELTAVGLRKIGVNSISEALDQAFYVK